MNSPLQPCTSAHLDVGSWHLVQGWTSENVDPVPWLLTFHRQIAVSVSQRYKITIYLGPWPAQLRFAQRSDESPALQKTLLNCTLEWKVPSLTSIVLHCLGIPSLDSWYIHADLGSLLFKLHMKLAKNVSLSNKISQAGLLKMPQNGGWVVTHIIHWIIEALEISILSDIACKTTST